MLKKMKLTGPILPQASNGILDKEGLQGQDIKVLVPIVSKGEFEIDDIITVYFTYGNYSVTSGLTVKTIPDEHFEIDFPEDTILTKSYNVHYTIEDTSGNSVDSDNTFIDVIDVGFFIIGARSTLYVTANGLSGPQCLTAWDKDHNPVSVTWSYIGTSKTDISWQNNPSSYFYDSAPYLPITATSVSGKTVTLSPLNIFGNGGTHDNVSSNYDEYYTHYMLKNLKYVFEYYGPPECFSSSFAALLNNHNLITWGNMKPGSRGIVSSNVKKVVVSGCGYLFLKTDGSISFCPVASDMALTTSDAKSQDKHTSPPAGNNFVDIGLAGTCAVSVRSDGTYKFWGYVYTYPGNIEGPLESVDDTLIFGDDVSLYLVNTKTASIKYTISMYTGEYGIHVDDPPLPLVNPRAISFLFSAINTAYITHEGTMKHSGLHGYPAAPVIEDAILLSTASTILTKVDDGLVGSRGYSTSDSVTVLNSSGQSFMSMTDLKAPWKIGDKVADISCNRHTAILRHRDGSITAVSKKYTIDNPSAIEKIKTDKKVIQVTCSSKAFAALHLDGTVTAWGDKDFGGYIDEETNSQLYGVRAIYATGKAFAALTSDNRVVTWGNHLVTENSQPVEQYVNGNISYYAPSE